MLTKEQIREKRAKDAYYKSKANAYKQIRKQQGASKWNIGEMLDEWDYKNTCGKVCRKMLKNTY